MAAASVKGEMDSRDDMGIQLKKILASQLKEDDK